MIQVPELNLSSGGARLISGAKLNALVAAVQARTQLDAAEAGPRGMAGQNTKGSGVQIPPFHPRYDPRRVYVLSPSFCAQLALAINARQPREAGSLDGSGWNVGGAGVLPAAVKPGRSGQALDAARRALRSATPRDAAETSAQGYRFAPEPRALRQASIVLDVQARWAEAFYCRGVFQSSTSTIYTSSTSTTHYANGDITTTNTQPNVGPKIWKPGHTLPVCDSVVVTDDRIPGHTYGAVISTTPLSYSGAVTASDAYDAAKTAVDDDGAPTTPGSWSWWEHAAPASAAFDSFAAARFINPAVGDYYVTRNRYRWRNTGRLHITVDWTEGGTSHTETLAPGDSSSWYDGTIPITAGVISSVAGIAFSVPP